AVSGADYNGVSASSVSVSITDNDQADFIVTVPTPLQTTEQFGGTLRAGAASSVGATKTISLSGSPDLSKVFVGQALVFGGSGANSGLVVHVASSDNVAKTLTT